MGDNGHTPVDIAVSQVFHTALHFLDLAVGNERKLRAKRYAVPRRSMVSTRTLGI